MTDIEEVMESIRIAILRARDHYERPDLVDLEDVITHELHPEGSDNTVGFPLVELTAVSVTRNATANKDLVSYVLDDDGNVIGSIVDIDYDARIQADLYVADAGSYDATKLGRALQQALYRYDDGVKQDAIPDPENPERGLSSVTQFIVGDGERRDQLTSSPAMRRWMQTLQLTFVDRINTVEEYGPQPFIRVVRTPEPGKMTSTDPDGKQVEYHPPIEDGGTSAERSESGSEQD